jgi:ArsR family transcriptional regulator
MGGTDLLEGLRAVGEPTRLRMLQLLVGWSGPRAGPLQPGEPGLCLSDVELVVGLPHPLVCHHLRILKRAGLVEADRRGRWTVYRARQERLAELAIELRRLSIPDEPLPRVA